MLDNNKEETNMFFAAGSSAYVDIFQSNSHSPYFNAAPGKKSIGDVLRKNATDKKPTILKYKLDNIKKEFTICDEKEEALHLYSMERVTS